MRRKLSHGCTGCFSVLAAAGLSGFALLGVIGAIAGGGGDRVPRG